jgi:hypothetical protein
MPARVYRGSKNIKNIPSDESGIPLGHYNIKIIKIYRLIYKNGSGLIILILTRNI